MGVYSDYLNAGLDFNQLEAERKSQLQRIAQIAVGMCSFIPPTSACVSVHPSASSMPICSRSTTNSGI
jgi:hypothetical protein